MIFDGKPSDFYNWREKMQMKIDAARKKAMQQQSREVARRTTRDHAPDEAEQLEILQAEFEGELADRIGRT